jgi:RNA polymerase sigma-70 factor (ECF subfamily)
MSSENLEFSARIREHIPKLDLYVASKVPKQYVDDVCSDAIAIAWQKREKIHPIDINTGADPMLPFLILTARNLIKNLERKIQTSRRNLRDLLLPDVESAETLALKDPQLGKALSDLKEKDKEIILLHAWHDFSISEIARILGISNAIVSVRLSRARNRLAMILQEYDAEEH